MVRVSALLAEAFVATWRQRVCLWRIHTHDARCRQLLIPPERGLEEPRKPLVLLEECAPVLI